MARRRWMIGIALAITLTAAACGSSDNNSSSGSTSGSPATTGAGGATTASMEGCDALKGAKIGYSEPLPDPNFAIIEAVLKDQLQKVDASLVAVNANLDPGKQISDIQSLKQQGVKALLVNPVDPNAVQGAIGEFRSAGIPVVVQDTKVGGPYTTNVTADVESAAAEGARRMKELVGDGQVGAIYGPNFAEVLTREAEAFKKTAAEIGLNVVDSQTNQMITPDGAAQIASAWKQQYGSKLAGIWTFNDTSAVGVASTIGGDFKPVIVSINGQPEAIPLVQSGVIDTTYDLQQDMLGRGLAFAAINAVCGRTLPQDIWIHNEVINKGNAGQWVNPEDRAKNDVTVSLEETNGQTFLVPQQ